MQSKVSGQGVIFHFLASVFANLATDTCAFYENVFQVRLISVCWYTSTIISILHLTSSVVAMAYCIYSLLISLLFLPGLVEAGTLDGPPPRPGKPESLSLPAEVETFQLAGRPAFVIEPPASMRRPGPLPWVWYAPTLPGLPSEAENWMFERFQRAGIAIAGIDVGESYGSPAGTALFQKLYDELTGKRNYARRPVLLARSRGGLMLYNWAVEHPDSVGGVAGIYPVCNLTSYPGLARAAPAYQMTADQLRDRLAQQNPVDRLASLAEAQVPLFHIHGDRDKVVPLEQNSALLAERYRKLGGPVELEVVAGQGHNMWRGWFESQALVDFVIACARGVTRDGS